MKKIFLILAAIVSFGINVNAHKTSTLETSKFLILIENTEDGIKLTGKQGCAFEELTFSLKKGQTQEIDQFGMRDKDENVREAKDENLASFCFKITKMNGGSFLEVVLEGIEGTTWKELSFGIPSGSQLIDENGMK